MLLLCFFFSFFFFQDGRFKYIFPLLEEYLVSMPYCHGPYYLIEKKKKNTSLKIFSLILINVYTGLFPLSRCKCTFVGIFILIFFSFFFSSFFLKQHSSANKAVCHHSGAWAQSCCNTMTITDQTPLTLQ